MSTYILMKILESAPSRYDRGIHWLTLGQVGRSQQRLVQSIQPGQAVLDIGCGTGALSLLAAEKGAVVKGIDINPAMLEIARQRAATLKLAHPIEFQEKGVAELDNEPDQSRDVVMSGLCFSELSENELDFALKQAFRILKPDGRLLIADEVVPIKKSRKILHHFIRLPLVVVTYLFTQTTTQAIRDLPEKIMAADFRIQSLRLNSLQSFIEIVTIKRKA